MAYRSGSVRVDISDVIDAIRDEDLLSELKARKLSPAMPGETVDLDIVREAYDELLRGRNREAESILARLLFPKWKSAKDCQDDFDKFLSAGR